MSGLRGSEVVGGDGESAGAVVAATTMGAYAALSGVAVSVAAALLQKGLQAAARALFRRLRHYRRTGCKLTSLANSEVVWSGSYTINFLCTADAPATSAALRGLAWVGIQVEVRSHLHVSVDGGMDVVVGRDLLEEEEEELLKTVEEVARASAGGGDKNCRSSSSGFGDLEAGGQPLPLAVEQQQPPLAAPPALLELQNELLDNAGGGGGCGGGGGGGARENGRAISYI